MRIHSLLLNNIILNNRENLFKEGNILEGKIIEILNKTAIIDIKNHGMFEASLDTDFNIEVNDEISFLVKSFEDNKIHLKPLPQEQEKNISIKTNEKAEDYPIVKVLKDLNIKETKESIELVKSLMKYNIPITEKNLNYCLKTLEKLYQLSNLEDNEKVILLNPNNGEKEDNKLLMEKADIRSFLITDKNEYAEHKDISQQIKDFIRTEIKSSMRNQEKISTLEEVKESIIKEDITKENSIKENMLRKNETGNTKSDTIDTDIKIISFFLKNSIKPSLNNIKNIKAFNEDPIEFSKDFKEIDNILGKLKPFELTKGQFKLIEENLIKNINLNKDERIAELQKNISNQNNNLDKEVKEEISRLETKIDFLREINKDLSFVFFPIKHEKNPLDGIITLIKKDKRKKSYNDKVNVFINLQTHNLGNIKVSCELLSKNLYIKINVKNEDLELFKSKEEHLIEKIRLIGYSLDRIEFIVDNNIEILDSIAPNPNPTYILDLKV